MTRRILLFSLLLVSGFSAFGQFITYSKQPQQAQLLQRNLATNRATVQLTGTVPSWANWTKIELRASNEQGALPTVAQNLTFVAGAAAFNFSLDIQAVRSNHTLQIFGFNAQTQAWVADKKFERLLAGDIFVINGQSNAVALSSPDLIDIDEYTRGWFPTYGWGTLNLSYPGRWGARIAARIADDLNVPAAIFNGANGALKVSDLLPRPADATANYSMLLKTMDDAGTGRRARAAFFFQGEADAWETSIADYKSQFLQLKNAWKADFGIEKAYIFQMRYQSCTSTRPLVLEAQRQAAAENADVSIMSTTNAEHDGCHFYENNAYRVLADRMFELVGNEIYGQNFADAASPDVDSVFQINSTTLEVKMKNATALQIIGTPWADWKIEGPTPVSVSSGSVSGARIRLNLAAPLPATATGLSYLNHTGPANHHLANQKGVGILAFFDSKIYPAGTVTPPPPPPPSGLPDLELTAATATPNPAIYSLAAVTFSLKNNSTTAATGIRLNILVTGQLVFEGGNEFTVSAGGTFNPFTGDWQLPALAANATATLTVRFFTLTGAATSVFGQVMAQSPADSDAQAGNGSATAATFQDDEAIVRFNGAGVTPPPPPPPTGQPNCAAKSLFPWEDWIADVRIGQTFSRPSSKTPFSDFSATPIALVRGVSQVVTLTSGFSYFTFAENWRIWIDLNNNSIFEANEKLFEGISAKPADGTPAKSIIGSLTIPATTAVGRLKMRVVMRRGAFGEACGDVPFGEVEDYAVDVLASLAGGASNRADDEEVEKPADFALFPNPAADFFELDLKKWAARPVSITAVNQLGQPVFSKKIDAASALETEKIALDGWQNGAYFLKIETPDRRPVVKKLAVARLF